MLHPFLLIIQDFSPLESPLKCNYNEVVKIRYLYGEDCQLRKEDYIEGFISQKKLNLDMINQFIMECPLTFPPME